MDTAADLPLSHVRVLELGSLLAGPMTGRVLADFGADVIKVEAPDLPDPLRHWGVAYTDAGDGLWWPAGGRNKRSITLNLRCPEGQSVFRQLAKHADVVIENFRPGTLDKWGVGYTALKEVNDRLILVSTSGYGQDGPYAGRAGFGSIAEAMGGIRYVTGYPDRPPTRVGISLGDSLAALHATIGCLVALAERERSGKGQVVDTAIYESVFALMESLVPDYLVAGHVRERSGTVLPGIAPSNTYSTSDGSFVVMGANSDNVFARLSEAIDKPELIEDERFATHIARGKHAVELDSLIEEWTRQRTSAECLAAFDTHGVPAGTIYSAQDIVEDPHYRARQMIMDVPHPVLGTYPMPGIVPKLSRTPGEVRWTGPMAPGEHNSEVYGSLLGYSPEHIAELVSQGVI